MASGRFFGSAYDGVDDGEFADGEGTLADAVENRSGVVDRVRPLPIHRSWRSCHSAARVRPKAGIPKISCEPPASVDSSCCWPPWRFIIVAAHKTPSRVPHPLAPMTEVGQQVGATVVLAQNLQRSV